MVSHRISLLRVKAWKQRNHREIVWPNHLAPRSLCRSPGNAPGGRRQVKSSEADNNVGKKTKQTDQTLLNPIGNLGRLRQAEL